MSQPSLRGYYDERYHYSEDIEQPNEDRLWASMRWLEPMADTTFLDVGCGVGWSGALASRRGKSRFAVGVDFSWRAISGAAARDAGGAWVQGDGTALPFADGAFDRAFSFGAMEHFPDVEAGFRELRRVLRTGARAVVVVPNFWVRTDQPQEKRGTVREWRGIVERAGFELAAVHSDRGPAILKNRRPHRALLRLAVRLLTYFPPLRYQHVLVLHVRREVVPGSPAQAAPRSPR